MLNKIENKNDFLSKPDEDILQVYNKLVRLLEDKNDTEALLLLKSIENHNRSMAERYSIMRKSVDAMMSKLKDMSEKISELENQQSWQKPKK